MENTATNELTLLYIEDDLEILENVSFLLSRYVQEVFTAVDGKEALDIYNEKKPDIIVTDINLPKINGLDLAAKIREENKHIPIVIITAYNEEEQLQKAREIQVSTYLQKPFTLQQLKDAITKAIEEKLSSIVK